MTFQHGCPHHCIPPGGMYFLNTSMKSICNHHTKISRDHCTMAAMQTKEIFLDIFHEGYICIQCELTNLLCTAKGTALVYNNKRNFTKSIKVKIKVEDSCTNCTGTRTNIRSYNYKALTHFSISVDSCLFPASTFNLLRLGVTRTHIKGYFNNNKRSCVDL